MGGGGARDRSGGIGGEGEEVVIGGVGRCEVPWCGRGHDRSCTGGQVICARRMRMWVRMDEAGTLCGKSVGDVCGRIGAAQPSCESVASARAGVVLEGRSGGGAMM